MKIPSRPEAARPDSGRETAVPADAAVFARGLSKHYRNPWTLQVTTGLDGLDLEVRRGEVMGYLGPNGSGKTTTLKLLTGLIQPSAGAAWLLGEPIANTASRRRLGFLPEQPYFYDYLNGVEYLEMAGTLSGLGGADAARRAKHWLGRVGLGDRPKLRLRKYSKGMLQRLGLAAALVHEPELLILDEPMSGLDPFGRRDVRELILEQKERGVTVLFSSHVLPDVEALCDRVAIVMRGRLQRVATVSELVEDGGHAVVFRCGGPAMVELPAGWNAFLERRDRAGETEFTLRAPARTHEVLAWLLQSRLELRAMTPHRGSLEELFLAAAGASGTPGERRTA